MLVQRVGDSGNPVGYGLVELDPLFFGDMVIYGFVFITLVQIISIIMGDEAPVLVIFIIKTRLGYEKR